MKKIINTLLVFSSAVILFSCSSSKQTAFAKRKYTHFKHADVQVALNKPETKERKNDFSTPIETNETAITPISVKKDIRNETLVSENTITAPVKQKKTSSTVRKEEMKTTAQKNTTKLTETKDAHNTTVEEHASTSSNINQVGLIVLAILLPPLAVYCKERDTSANFWIDLLLTLLFWVPGIIFAMLVIYGVA